MFRPKPNDSITFQTADGYSTTITGRAVRFTPASVLVYVHEGAKRAYWVVPFTSITGVGTSHRMGSFGATHGVAA